jgi:hypothetical protein
MTQHRTPLIAAAAALLLSSIALAAPEPVPVAKAAPAPAAKAAAKGAPGPVAPEDMSGLVFDGLTPEQKTLAVSILNENSCDCGCGMKLGVCRRDDPKCPRSPTLGKQVIDLVKEGKSRDAIVKAVLTPPSKFVQFPLAAGQSPSIGPKDAKVTILYYLDYQ